MALHLIGTSHKSSALELRETLAAAAGDALARLQQLGVREAVVLATCNRFEIYHGDDPKRVRAWLDDLAEGKLGEQAYEKAGPDVVRHLFAVAAGLESLVVGEAEILGQVKQAYDGALAAQMTGKLTNVLFQRALFVGKMVRNKTGISMGQLSVASVAVAMAERIFGSLKQSSVLILGAGTMAEATAKHLISAKAAKLFLANRTWEKGVELAKRYGAEPVRWSDFPALLHSADIVISSTGATEPVIKLDMVQDAARARKGRSLFLIDIAMPRDIEAGAHGIDHVYLYTMDDLQGIVSENLSKRHSELEAAKELVDAQSADFEAWLSAHERGDQAALRHSGRPVSARLQGQ